MKPYLESEVYVPSEGDPASLLWLIGEAPGYDETVERKPFVGRAGQLLDQVLSANGIQRSKCFITNLCHYRPKGNKFELLSGTFELQQGILELNDLRAKYKPNLIVCLGNAPLSYICERNGITAWRGSILESSGIKCIPTFHPAYTLRDPLGYPILLNDFARIAKERLTPNVPSIEWNFQYGKGIHSGIIDYYLNSPTLAVDIESVKESSEIICVGFARSNTEAISIAASSPHEREWIQRLLSCDAQKIFHFGTFDTTMLRMNGYEIKNYVHDTIIQAHILNPELPRDLGFLTSIYTNIPYYKSEGRSNIPSDTKGWTSKRNKEELYIYNCKDCCATYQVYEVQKEEIEADADFKRLYEYEMELVQCTNEIGMNGMLRDPIQFRTLKNQLEVKQQTLKAHMDIIVGMNVNSPKQVQHVLYNVFKLPKRTNRESGNLTSDNDALISLINVIKTKLNELKMPSAINEWKVRLAFVQLVIQLRGVEKLISSYINILISPDGRVRSLYKVAGTETGRLSCSKYVDGTGCNMQTIPRETAD